MTQAYDHPRPLIAVSACLLGQQVRFDGGHKQDRFITDQLSQNLDFIAVCPEQQAGMSTPRPAIQLHRIGDQIRLVQSNETDIDHTEKMIEVAEQQSRILGPRVSGFIAQRKSPSCGFERVPVSNGANKRKDYNGVGLFTQHFSRLCPLIPIEEEGRLNDPFLRENFLARVYAFDRRKSLDVDDVSGFIDFHSRHKLMLLLQGSDSYRRLGRIVAGVTAQTLAERRNEYIHLFMGTLAKRATRKHHYNVLQHIMGYFKKAISGDDKQELLNIFQSYRESQVPLSTPLTLLSHHLRKNPDGYLERQHYFKPYPASLALRAQL